MTVTLHLDSNIRDWVLFPIVLITVAAGLFRHYLSALLARNPKPVVGKVRNHNAISYANLLMSAGEMLSTSSLQSRVQETIHGELKREPETENPMDMMDPNMLSDSVRMMAMSMGNNVGLLMLISFFFSGFIVARFPFPVSFRFKDMMQRGVEIDDLDCCYATSMSFYFLAMYGTSGILQLLLGSDVEGVDAAMQQQMPQPMNQAVDFKKVYAQLSEDLRLCASHHKWSIDESPQLLFKQWRTEKQQRNRRAQ